MVSSLNHVSHVLAVVVQRKMIRFDSNASSTGGAERPPTPADSVLTELTEEDMDATPVFGTCRAPSVVSPPGTEMVPTQRDRRGEEEEGAGEGGGEEEAGGEAAQGGARAVRHLSGLANSPSGTML